MTDKWKLVPPEPTGDMLVAASDIIASRFELDGPAEHAWYEQFVLDVYKAMLAAAPDPWQPIETAPKDRTKVVAYRPRPDISCYDVAAHDPEQEWWEDQYGDIVADFTHWMPLPEPPKGNGQ